MTIEQQHAMDLDFRQAGVNPRDTLPLLGRRVWVAAGNQSMISGDLAYRAADLGGEIVLWIDGADLVIIPAGMEHRYTARVRTHASRAGVPVLFEAHIDALTEANSGRAHADLAAARLIAAAPELLEALQAQILPRAKGWNRVDWEIRDKEARAAIDKAKGDRGKRSHCGDLQKRRTTRRGIRTS